MQEKKTSGSLVETNRPGSLIAYQIMPTRLITFAGTTLSIEYYGDRPVRILDFLYGHLTANGSDVSQVNYRLLPHPQGGTDQLTLYCDDKLLRQSDDEAAMASFLLGNSCFNLAYHSRGGVLFHAAGLARQGDHGASPPRPASARLRRL